MAIKHTKYLWAAVIESCISIAFLSTCLATEHWVEAEAYTKVGQKNYLNYGLIQGSFYEESKNIPEGKHNIYLTCIDDKQCAYSCRSTVEARIKELEIITSGKAPDFYCNDKVFPTDQLVEPVETLNMSVYDSTYILLIVALVFAIISAIFEIYNILGTPESNLLGTLGLTLWNAVPIICSAVILIMWGVYYKKHIFTNLYFIPIMVGTNYALILSNLGYSYWFVFVPFVSHIMNEILLIVRWTLLKKNGATV